MAEATSPADNPTMSAAEYRKSGEEALEALDAEAAAAFFRAALAKDSSCVASLNGLADALIATGDGEGARVRSSGEPRG